MTTTLTSTELFHLYLVHQLTSHYKRAEVSKLFTKYNKANKTAKIYPALVLKERFPQLFRAIQERHPTVPEHELFESNFSKLLFNLNILPTRKTHIRSYNNKAYNVFESLTPSVILDCYLKFPAKILNTITSKIYEQDGYRFVSQDGTDSFSLYDMALLVPILREI